MLKSIWTWDIKDWQVKKRIAHILEIKKNIPLETSFKWTLISPIKYLCTHLNQKIYQKQKKGYQIYVPPNCLFIKLFYDSNVFREKWHDNKIKLMTQTLMWQTHKCSCRNWIIVRPQKVDIYENKSRKILSKHNLFSIICQCFDYILSSSVSLKKKQNVILEFTKNT